MKKTSVSAFPFSFSKFSAALAAALLTVLTAPSCGGESGSDPVPASDAGIDLDAGISSDAEIPGYEDAAAGDAGPAGDDAGLQQDDAGGEGADASGADADDAGPLGPEPYCGDGIRQSEHEICDGDDGVPAGCEALDPLIQWSSGGKPGCSADCSAVTRGTCLALDEREITFVNWNVQADYASWGAPLVPPRAAKMKEMLGTWQSSWRQMPAAIAIIEASPSWHTPEYTKIFNDFGYFWVDDYIEIQDKWNGFECGENNENVTFDLDSGLEDPNAASCFLMSTLLFRKSDFDLIDADYVKLKTDSASPFINNKIIATCAVLREKATGQQFIPCSTHWLANDGVILGNGLPGIFGPVLNRERGRVEGAHIAAAFVQDWIARYPDAHVFFGGDFNTLNMEIIFKSEAASALLGSNWSELAAHINAFLVGSDYEPVDENFRSSHYVFAAESGLSDARNDAAQRRVMQGPGDVKTSSDPNLPDILAQLGIPVVIDYAFHSPSMDIMSYEVVMDDAGSYEAISDHYPVKTSYIYRVPGEGE